MGSGAGTSMGNAAMDAFMEDWDEVVHADSLSTYCTKWKDLHSQHRRKVGLLDYLRNTWLPLKEHFMAIWIY